MFISNCCGAKVIFVDLNSQTGLCTECKEHCDCEKEEDSEFCNGKMD